MTTRRSPHWTRRDALKLGLSTTAAATLPTWFVERCAGEDASTPAEKSPNDRPRVALIGCGGMGMGDAASAAKFGDIVALCDVDASHLGKAKEKYKKAKTYRDYREVCDLPNIDIILNATPDHWHTLVNLRAVHSGKDVYSEKPLTLTIDEGKRLVAAVKKTGRILQTGSQQRSNHTFRLACELVRNGRVGKVKTVRVWLPTGLREGPFANKPVPKELNWDAWQGQTPTVEYVPERCHRMFRYWYAYSGGTMTDWGAHHNDIAMWGLGRDGSGPVSVEGERLIDPIPGGYETASQYRVKYVYDDGVEQHTVTTSANGWAGGVLGKPKEGEKYHGVQFEGPEGWIYVTRGDKIEASDPALLETPLPASAKRVYTSNDHMGNFFDCVKSRKDPVCAVEIGHRSASICHLGSIAVRLGRKLNWDPRAETFNDDSDANKMLAREMRKPYSYEDA